MVITAYTLHFFEYAQATIITLTPNKLQQKGFKPIWVVFGVYYYILVLKSPKTFNFRKVFFFQDGHQND